MQSSSCVTTDDVDASSCTGTNQTKSSSSGVNSMLSKLRTPHAGIIFSAFHCVSNSYGIGFASDIKHG